MRILPVLLVATTVAMVAAACGGGDSTTSEFDGGTDDASTFDSGPGIDASFGSDANSDGGVLNGCKPLSCADQKIGCGDAGDGCGNIIHCGSCTPPQTCGGGAMPSQCGGSQGCVPKTCQQLNVECGAAADGCGSLLNCGTCTAPAACGGGGTPFKCGSAFNPDGGAANCTPKTCAQLGKNCGPVADGCGNLLQCGTCQAPNSCGAGGVPSVCGSPSVGGGADAGDAGNPFCTPQTCAQLGVACGPAGDGCGGVLNCGTCQAPQSCGGGGVANQCGAPQCTPRTCTQLGLTCGPAGDGCGGVLSCGSCQASQSCGGGGVPGKCGQPACTPKTCAQLGVNCGFVADGCGNAINCGSCQSPQFCGGGGPNLCGVGNVNPGDAGVFVTCDSGGNTTITGVVYAGTDPTLGFGIPDPVYNAVVYVPSGPLQPITTGATCDKCAAPQSALVSTTTAVDGSFTLTNPPVGPSVPLVVQVGKWRRQVNINVTACTNNQISANCAANWATCPTRLPRNRNEGDIPRFAIDTGSVDAMECVLRKMGIEDAEFVNPAIAGGAPTAAGRVHIYQGNPTGASGAAGGAVVNATTPVEDSLINTPSVMNSYDIILFPCEGGADNETVAAQQNLINYTNAGGRVFATHFSYVWLYNDPPFSGTAVWQPDTQYNGQLTGIIDQSFPKGQALAQWLTLVVASTTPGQIPVNVVRKDFNSVVAPSQRWMYITSPAPAPIHYTFNTPVGAAPANQCGRVVYSDFHVENSSGSNGLAFPTECNANSPLTPQEKLLEFMLFDLSSCVAPDVPTCTPLTCGQQNIQCGAAGDGCGGQIACGNCQAGQVCQGNPAKCVPVCTPLTCAQQGINCGPAGDGCGGSLNCGPCTPPQICGGGGVPGVCGAPRCTPKTCAGLGVQCGPAGDGCGNLLQCGSCATGQLCGAGGQPGVCGVPDGGFCTPITCAQQGLSCGPAGDGCGNVIQCGSCPTGQSCGGGGVPGVCGAPTCKPVTCAQLGLNCGPAGDGCGGQLNCGTCTPPQTCGGGGQPGVCGAPSCTPRTCAQAGANCGVVADGCGGTINCGTCIAPNTCGGGGTPNQCSSNTPR